MHNCISSIVISYVSDKVECSRELLWNAVPLLLGDAVLVDENIVSEGVEVAAENQWGIHEGAGVDKLAFFADLHLLDVEYEAAVEDLEGEGALTAKYEDLVVRDLVGQAHISRDPLGLVKRGGSASDLLPNVLGDIIALNCVNYVLLVDSAAKSEDEVVLERAESDARSRHSQAVNLLPLVLLDVVNLAESVDLAVDEGTYNVDESFHGAQRMISVRIDHRRLLIKLREDLVVSVAFLQVRISSLVATSNQVDATVLGSDRSGVEGDLDIHLDSSLFEDLVVDLVDVGVLLVPLE